MTAKVWPNTCLGGLLAKPGGLKWLTTELGAERITLGAGLRGNMALELFGDRGLGLAPDVWGRCLAVMAVEVLELHGRVDPSGRSP